MLISRSGTRYYSKTESHAERCCVMALGRTTSGVNGNLSGYVMYRYMKKKKKKAISMILYGEYTVRFIKVISI